jgi:hypothetical protein
VRGFTPGGRAPSGTFVHVRPMAGSAADGTSNECGYDNRAVEN